MITIGLDAGHGLKTAGKQTPSGVKEWALNDVIADKVTINLSGYNCDIIRTDNNEGNTDESLSYRLNKYLNAGVDVFVSIHHNAFKGIWGTATGVEVYVDKNATDADLKLAECIYSKLVKYTGLKGRGIKRANFTVINQNKIPAVLVEGGFMDSRHDYNVITSEAGQDAYARAVAEGIIEFKKLQKKYDPTPENNVQRKSITEIAQEVIQGKWGNGSARKTNLVCAGYNYSEVQAEVNRLVKGDNVKPVKKSNAEIAKEVMEGKWGNGQERKDKLANAGYDYTAIQIEVNKLVGKPTTPVKKSNEEVAREVLAGKWGNGIVRRKRLTDAGYNYSVIQTLVNKLAKK